MAKILSKCLLINLKLLLPLFPNLVSQRHHLSALNNNDKNDQMKNVEIAKALETIRKHVICYPDFPKPGVSFQDVTATLRNPEVFATLRRVLAATARTIEPPVECIAALDARGFLFGPIVALDLEVPFVPVRKTGKLPGEVVSQRYELEYGSDCFEVQRDAFRAGQKVLLMDDVLATGGSMRAAIDLIEKTGAEVVGCLVVMELVELNGRAKLNKPLIPLLQN